MLCCAGTGRAVHAVKHRKGSFPGPAQLRQGGGGQYVGLAGWVVCWRWARCALVEAKGRVLTLPLNPLPPYHPTRAALDLPDDFQHMHSLLCLHVWLLLVRLRPEGKSGKQLAQNLYDNFQDDVERRVRGAGVKVSEARAKSISYQPRIV